MRAIQETLIMSVPKRKRSVPRVELNIAICSLWSIKYGVKLSNRFAVLIVFLLMLSVSMSVIANTVMAQVLSIDVEFVSSPPAYVNQTFEIVATVSGGTPPYTYQWYTQWFPPWKAGMDPAQYRASGGSEIAVPNATFATFKFIPTAEGIYWIGVGVSDSAGNYVSRFPSILPLQLTVNNPVPQATLTPETPTSTPSVPEFSLLAILPLFVSIPLIAVVLRHRKNA